MLARNLPRLPSEFARNLLGTRNSLGIRSENGMDQPCAEFSRSDDLNEEIEGLGCLLGICPELTLNSLGMCLEIGISSEFALKMTWTSHVRNSPDEMTTASWRTRYALS